MNNHYTKILLLVEGASRDKELMNHLLKVYGISASHQIVSYNTSIYDLYDRMFFDDDPEALDLLQVLKEHEKDPSVRAIFDEHYSDVILIFDLDPQAPAFASEKIIRMTEFFNESTENGKLYINYPMVEAFYHMKSIPDPDYNSYSVSMTELKEGNFKDRTKKICRIPYKRFAATKAECNIVINQNLQKAQILTQDSDRESLVCPLMSDILKVQIYSLVNEGLLFVLCTCIFYIIDFNPNLVSPCDDPAAV